MKFICIEEGRISAHEAKSIEIQEYNVKRRGENQTRFEVEGFCKVDGISVTLRAVNNDKATMEWGMHLLETSVPKIYFYDGYATVKGITFEVL